MFSTWRRARVTLWVPLRSEERHLSLRQLTYGAAANSLRGLTKRSQKRATHPLAINKPGFRGDHFHGVPRTFYHDPRRLQPELFDGLRGRLSRFGSKCATELTRT